MKLKVCGLNNRENILEVLECKPDYIGFIFYEKSPRFVGELNANSVKWISSAKKVGVFVNESENIILDCVSAFGLDHIQLHGNESPEFCASLGKQISIIKAFQINDDFDFTILNSYQDVCDYFLFDSKSEQFGGSGKTFNHDKLAEYKLEKPYFLSGGLSLENIKEVKEAYCLDVNSQFEISTGIKDINKLNRINLATSLHNNKKQPNPKTSRLCGKKNRV
jgi:phosphoribosylanthranilate isomerase